VSINDVPIHETDRVFRWELGVRPEVYRGISGLGL